MGSLEGYRSPPSTLASPHPTFLCLPALGKWERETRVTEEATHHGEGHSHWRP